MDTAQRRRLIEQMGRDGFTVAKIAIAADTSPQNVRYHLDRLGIQPTPGKRGRRRES